MKCGCFAQASICGDGNHPNLRGTVRFFPCGRGTMVVARVQGLPDSERGFFGFHIHEGGDCRGQDFPNTGGHYDPVGNTHPRHAGDLPPLLGAGGRAYLAVLTDRFRLEDIIGRTVVIHSHPDDFKTQPSGAAGSRIGCGVIQKRCAARR